MNTRLLVRPFLSRRALSSGTRPALFAPLVACRRQLSTTAQALGELVAIGLTLSAVGVAGAYTMQGRMLYMPTRQHDDHPSQYPGMGYCDVHLRAADGTMLHAWLVHDKLVAPATASASASASAPPDVLLIHLHGNAGNISHRLGGGGGLLGMIRALAPVCRLHVLLLDYRGYGASDNNEPDERGLRQDAAAALEWAHGAVCDGRFSGGVFVLGRSLGGAVVTAMCEDAGAADAADAQADGRAAGSSVGVGPDERLLSVLRGVMLENTFCSIEDMIAVHYAPLVPVVAAAPWLLRSKWRTRDRLPLLGGSMPTLMLSGRQDDIVPPQQMDALHAAAAMPHTDGSASDSDSDSAPGPSFVAFQHGGHNDTFLQPGYHDAVRDFICDNMRGRPVVVKI